MTENFSENANLEVGCEFLKAYLTFMFEKFQKSIDSSWQPSEKKKPNKSSK